MADPSLDRLGLGHRARALRARRTPTSTGPPGVAVPRAAAGGVLGAARRRHRPAPLGDQRPSPPHLRAASTPRRIWPSWPPIAGSSGPGVGMLTAVDVRTVWRGEDGGAAVSTPRWASRSPTWAAAPDEATATSASRRARSTSWASSPNACRVRPWSMRVMTVTEAKAQALWDAGVRATGTASDAVCVVCPDEGLAQPFGGPRSPWGARLARAVHRAVRGWLSPDADVVITLVLGGARSGKSVVAEGLVAALAPPVTYVATLDVGDDADLAARVARHRARRPPTGARSKPDPISPRCSGPWSGTVLVDSLGPWVGARPRHGGGRRGAVRGAGRARRGHGRGLRGGRAVGASVDRAGRLFRDALGALNQAVAAARRRGHPRRGGSHPPPRPAAGLLMRRALAFLTPFGGCGGALLGHAGLVPGRRRRHRARRGGRVVAGGTGVAARRRRRGGRARCRRRAHGIPAPRRAGRRRRRAAAPDGARPSPRGDGATPLWARSVP